MDPEELPDYHDVIEHPMDFGTVRRKVAGGLYRSFEQFEVSTGSGVQFMSVDATCICIARI